MDIIIKFLMAVDVIVALILCILIFLQRSKSGGGLGGLVGGGATEDVLGAGGTSFVVKATIVFTAIFLLNTLGITSLQARSRSAGDTSSFENHLPAAAGAASSMAPDASAAPSSADVPATTPTSAAPESAQPNVSAPAVETGAGSEAPAAAAPTENPGN